jgi:hypothetical protein
MHPRLRNDRSDPRGREDGGRRDVRHAIHNTLPGFRPPIRGRSWSLAYGVVSDERIIGHGYDHVNRYEELSSHIRAGMASPGYQPMA